MFKPSSSSSSKRDWEDSYDYLSTKWPPEDSPWPLENQETKRKKKRRSRWVEDENKKVYIPGLPTVLPNNLNPQQEKTYLLQLQIEEINRCLRSRDLGISQNPEERSPSPEPIYNSDGYQLNTREHRTRKKLEDDRSNLIQELYSCNPNYKPSPGPAVKVSEKVMIPQVKHPDVNFVGLIIGPRGNTVKTMEKEMGTKIFIRSDMSDYVSKFGQALPGENETLHALITGYSNDSVKKTADMIRMIIQQAVELPEEENTLRRKQLRELKVLKSIEDKSNMSCSTKSEATTATRNRWQCTDKYNIMNNYICTNCGSTDHISEGCRDYRILSAAGTIQAPDKATIAKRGGIMGMLTLPPPPSFPASTQQTVDKTCASLSTIREKVQRQVDEINRSLAIRDLGMSSNSQNRQPDIVSGRVMIPQLKYPEINFSGLLIGPRGNTLKSVEKETGTKIYIRNDDSVKLDDVEARDGQPLLRESLYALITSYSNENIKKAADMIYEIMNQAVELPEEENTLRCIQKQELAVLKNMPKLNVESHSTNCRPSTIAHNSWMCTDERKITTAGTMGLKEMRAKISNHSKGSVEDSKEKPREGQSLPQETLHTLVASYSDKCINNAVNKIREMNYQGVVVTEDEIKLRYMQLPELAELSATQSENDRSHSIDTSKATTTDNSWRCTDRLINNNIIDSSGSMDHIAMNCHNYKTSGTAGTMDAHYTAKTDKEITSLMFSDGQNKSTTTLLKPQDTIMQPSSIFLPPPVLSQASLPVMSQSSFPVMSQSSFPVMSQASLPVMSQASLPVMTQASLPVMSQAHVPVMSQAPFSVMSQVPPPVMSQVPPPVMSQVPPPVMSQVPSSVTSHMQSSVLSQMQSSVMSQMSSFMSQIPPSTMSQMPPATKSQMASSTMSQMSSYMSQMPPSTMSQMPASTMSQMPASTISQMPASTISQMPASTISQMPASTMSQIHAPVMSLIPAAVMAQMPAHILSQITPLAISQFSSALMSQIAPTVISQFPSAVMSQVPSAVMSQVPSAVMSQVPSAVISQVPSAVMSQVPSAVMSQVPSAVMPQMPLYQTVLTTQNNVVDMLTFQQPQLSVQANNQQTMTTTWMTTSTFTQGVPWPMPQDMGGSSLTVPTPTIQNSPALNSWTSFINIPPPTLQTLTASPVSPPTVNSVQSMVANGMGLPNNMHLPDLLYTLPS